MAAYEKGYVEAAEIMLQIVNHHHPGQVDLTALECTDDESGWTTLHWAAFRNHSLGIATLLAAAPTAFTAHDLRGMHPFHVACAHRQSLRCMLQHIYSTRSYIELLQQNGWTAAMEHTAIACGLLDGDEQQALASMRRMQPTEWLQPMQNGMAPCHFLVAFADDAGCIALLRNLPEACWTCVDQLGQTPLHWAAQVGNHLVMNTMQSWDDEQTVFVAPQMVPARLELSPPHCELDTARSTCAHSAGSFAARRTGSMERRAEAPRTEAQQQEYITHRCGQPASMDNWKQVDSLLRNALHLAAYSGCARSTHAAIMQLCGHVPIDDCDEQGLTPMHHAAMSGSVATIDVLAEAGHPVDPPDTIMLRTPLSIAVSTQREDAACALVLQGANPLAAASDHQTENQVVEGVDVFSPLHHAIRNKMWRFVDLTLNMLFRQGALGSRGANLTGLPALADVVDCDAAAPTLLWLLDRAAAFGTSCFQQLLDCGGEDEVYCMLREASATNFVELVQLFCLCFKHLVCDPPEGFQFTALHSAARHGSSECIRLLVQSGADVGAGDKNLDTPLHWAGFMGQIHAVTTLLNLGADVTQTNRDGGTSLHSAANHGAVGVGQVLLAAGSDPNLRMRDGNAPLHNSCYEGHCGFVGLLLEHGADPSTRNDEGRTALHEAACNGHASVIVTLCRGGNITYKQQLQQELQLQSALLQVARSSELPGSIHSTNCDPRSISRTRSHGNNTTVQPYAETAATYGVAHRVVSGIRSIFMIRGRGRSEHGVAALRGAAADADSASPANASNATSHLFWQMMAWSKSMQQFDVNAIGPPSGTPLAVRREVIRAQTVVGHMKAMHTGHSESIRGSHTDAAVNSSSPTMEGSDSGSIAFKQARRAPLNAQDSGGDTALHWTVCNGHVECTRQLLRHGAAVGVHNVDGGLPLHAAIINGRVQCLRLLLNHGADANSRFANRTAHTNGQSSSSDSSIGDSAALVACADGQAGCLAVLLKAGASLRAVSSRSRTPLHEACRGKHIRCIELILQHGVTLDSIDARGRSPLMLLLPYPPKPKGGSWDDALAALGSVPMSKARKPRASPDNGFHTSLFSELLADVELVAAGGEVIPAHRIIISARMAALGSLVEMSISDIKCGCNGSGLATRSPAGAASGNRGTAPTLAAAPVQASRCSTSSRNIGKVLTDCCTQYVSPVGASLPRVQLGIPARVLRELLRFAYTGDVSLQPPSNPSRLRTSNNTQAVAGGIWTPAGQAKVGLLSETHQFKPGPEQRAAHANLWLQLLETAHQFALDEVVDIAIDRLNRPQALPVILAMHQLSLLLGNARLRLVSIAQLCSVQAGSDMQQHIATKQDAFDTARGELLLRQRQRCQAYSQLRGSLLVRLACGGSGIVTFTSPPATAPASPAEFVYRATSYSSHRHGCISTALGSKLGGHRGQGIPAIVTNVHNSKETPEAAEPAGHFARVSYERAYQELADSLRGDTFPLQPLSGVLYDLLHTDWDEYRRLRGASRSRQFVYPPFPPPPPPSSLSRGGAGGIWTPPPSTRVSPTAQWADQLDATRTDSYTLTLGRGRELDVLLPHAIAAAAGGGGGGSAGSTGWRRQEASLPTSSHSSSPGQTSPVRLWPGVPALDLARVQLHLAGPSTSSSRMSPVSLPGRSANFADRGEASH